MHDWTDAEAKRAAEERHGRVLKQHHGTPVSDGHRLIVVCDCGARCAPGQWEAHLVYAAEKASQPQ
jgi:hypothetical protein